MNDIIDNEIILQAQLYIDTLPPGMEYVGNHRIMSECLKYIARQLFIPTNNNKVYNKENNKEQSSNIDYDNLEQLEYIWNSHCYILHNIFNLNVTLLTYSIMTNIDYYTIERWMNAPKRDKIGLLRSALFKKFHKQCETDNIFDNSIKSMFLLKSVYGYQEQPQQIVISGTNLVEQSVDDLRSKYVDFKKNGGLISSKDE